MKIINFIQGSVEWQQFRQPRFGSSETTAMLGLSPNISRTELLHMKHTCTPKEFSDWVQLNILDYGHEVEAMARPLAEVIIGTELYPVTCADDDERLIASCDGLTMAEDEGWEHKQWNAALAAAVEAGEVPDTHMPQVQQQLLVTGAARWLFMVSDGTVDNMVHVWVHPDESWFERIRAGWIQFEADLAVYEPKAYAPKPKADQIMALPALTVQIRGEVVATNLPLFKAKADHFIASIKTELVTDDDFANAEATIKFCEEAEQGLDQAKRAAISQTTSIDELMRTVDHISAQLRDKRLLLTRTVKDKKELLKAQILADVRKRFADHVAALDVELAPLRLVYQARDFIGAMKNKRTLATLHNAVDTELAAGKIAVDAIAKDWRRRKAWYDTAAAEHAFLFADLQTLIQKPDDDFQLAVTARIDAHKVAKESKATALAAQAAAKPEPAQAPAPAPAVSTFASIPVASSVGYGKPASIPTLRLGQICERLGFSVNAEFLASLGFSAQVEKGARLYHDSDFPNICAAIQRHISAVLAEQLAA